MVRFSWCLFFVLLVLLQFFNSGVDHVCRSCGWWYVPLASNNYGPSRQPICWGRVSCIHSLPTRLPIQATQGKSSTRVSIHMLYSLTVFLSLCVHFFSCDVIVFTTWNTWIVSFVCPFIYEKFLYFHYLPNYFLGKGGWDAWMLDLLEGFSWVWCV